MSTEEPVTVVVTRRVKPGREKDYEAWLEALLAKAKHLHAGDHVAVERFVGDHEVGVVVPIGNGLA